MKIKEFIRELGYAMTYVDNLKILLGNYDVRLVYDEEDITTNVYLDDFDGHVYKIAVLREAQSLIGDYYHDWCENELLNGETVPFKNSYDFDPVDTFIKHGIEFTFNGSKISVILSNREYIAPVTNSKYWELVWELIKLQTGLTELTKNEEV